MVRARHAITHRRITLEGYRSRLVSRIPSDPERFRWVTPDEGSEPEEPLAREAAARALGATLHPSLTAILGSAELLLKTRLDEEQEGYVRTMQRCGAQRFPGCYALSNHVDSHRTYN